MQTITKALRKIVLFCCFVCFGVGLGLYFQAVRDHFDTVSAPVGSKVRVDELVYRTEQEKHTLDSNDNSNLVQRKDTIDNSGAIKYLNKYKELFGNTTVDVTQADPNNPDTIKTWWQGAAMIDWYIHSPLRYTCKQRVAYGNWGVCQDVPYSVNRSCLVYSFGINNDFSFDDAMVDQGCEVHSFDPSMNQSDHKRGRNNTFHNLGLSNTNTDAFLPRRDGYVQDNQVWRIRTLKAIKQMLGHDQRVIDVLKIDVEGHEWTVIDNLIETDMFRYVRQFLLEFHLFSDWPLKQDYVNLYKIYTRLREMGFREFSVGPHPKTLTLDHFNNQGDSEFVNVFFTQP
ncbi:uncharacterized protein LOC131938318 [Physella acuta]|uniref:uncharacterized protein LOC131938318 n=1 Tax=Physella acuta TaxID=109671 RepID=UPI0027DBE5F2|nr:uncharacterized protein LOC131938318 [Physella acuta]